MECEVVFYIYKDEEVNPELVRFVLVILPDRTESTMYRNTFFIKRGIWAKMEYFPCFYVEGVYKMPQLMAFIAII